MNESAFDSLARHAGSSQNRRASLKVLGAAALAAAATAPLAAEAGKAGKKAKKKCKKQGNPCRAFAAELCTQFPQVQDCEEQFQPCCGSLQKCKAPAFFDCVAERLAELLEP